MSTPYAFFKNTFMPAAEAKVSIMTHALHYGTSCFEGIRGNWSPEEKTIYLFRLKEHFVRLMQSCSVLKISLPYSIDDMCNMAVKLVEMSGYREDIYIRPLAYKSTEGVGVKLHGLEADFCMFIIPFGPYIDIEKGVRCCTSSWRCISGDIIPSHAKIAGRYVNHALAKTEAIENGFDEAILLTREGRVSEGSGENIFIIENGKLITPAPSDNILIGITRNSVITIAKNELGMDTIERSIDHGELYMVDECFMTGTAAHVAPIIEIDRRKIGDGRIGPVTKNLQQLYFDVEKGKNKKYMKWCTPVTPK
ncbi:MAG: branched-chain amino acid transaminase [Chloroflexi bacterium]|nr:branched-chain amino acid transaminase [Chloroflexota bacterium]